MRIKLNLITDIQEFVHECQQYLGNIKVSQETFLVNGKSIFGLFSLNLSEEIVVSYEGENDVAEAEFYQYISKWKVEE